MKSQITAKCNLDMFDSVPHPDSDHDVVKTGQGSSTSPDQEGADSFVLINTTVEVPREDEILDNLLRSSPTDGTKVPGITGM